MEHLLISLRIDLYYAGNPFLFIKLSNFIPILSANADNFFFGKYFFQIYIQILKRKDFKKLWKTYQ